MIEINQCEFDELTDFIKSKYGINLKQKKVLVEGRLSNVIVDKGFKDFREFIHFVFQDKTGVEMTQLLNKLTTNHTFFLREPQHFDFLTREILPNLERTSKEKDIRIWSAGCSSGAEPYTIAMVLQDYFRESVLAWDLKVLATDISIKVLEQAVAGIYPKEDLADLPGMWKMNYFKSHDNNHFQVQEAIRKEVIFRVFNLMEEVFPFKKKFHLIFCRNVMIYFDQPTKNKLFRRFYNATEDGGYLFIGHSESMGKEDTGYKYVCPAVYRKGG